MPAEGKGVETLHIAQDAVDAVPTYFVDGYIGIATANGVARICFADTVFDVEPQAEVPKARPVLNLLIPESSLAVFASEMVARAPSNTDVGG